MKLSDKLSIAGFVALLLLPVGLIGIGLWYIKENMPSGRENDAAARAIARINEAFVAFHEKPECKGITARYDVSRHELIIIVHNWRPSCNAGSVKELISHIVRESGSGVEEKKLRIQFSAEK